VAPAVLDFFRHVHWAVQSRPRLLVAVLAPFFLRLLLAFALSRHPPVRYEFGRGRVANVDDLHAVAVVAHRAFHVREAVIGRRVEIGVLAAVVIAAVRAGSGLYFALRIALVAAPLRQR